MPQKILVGMSGGVDSAAAALLLRQQHFCPVGCTLRLLNGEKAAADARDAAAVCAKIGIEHKILDARTAFAENVMADFAAQYFSGNTPNPCIVCNRTVKFGVMLQAAKQMGIEKIATGHYAKIVLQNGRYLLCRAADRTKDQSYMLYSLSQRQLSCAVFPLGDYTKTEIREIAAAAGFEIAHKKDSQDICFVPNGDYAAVIESFTGRTVPPGDYVSPDGAIIGRHRGHIHYTVGQRKGLGIALGKPAFVLAKNAAENRVVLDTDSKKLFHSRVAVGAVNWIAQDAPQAAVRATVKLRYTQNEQPAWLHPTADGVCVEFDTPQRAPGPGQAAVFYDGEVVLGGGTIINAT